MPARLEEVRHAKEEGINFLNLHNPIEYIADENGAVCKAVLQVMELGEPDASGRRSPKPIEGKTLTVETDQVIVAVGVSPNPLVPKSIEGTGQEGHHRRGRLHAELKEGNLRRRRHRARRSHGDPGYGRRQTCRRKHGQGAQGQQIMPRLDIADRTNKTDRTYRRYRFYQSY